jgi:phosphate starvation-inducible PhoH-like protein
VEVTVQVPLGSDRVSILGAAERNLKMIREALGVNVTAREGLVHLKGDRRAVVAARGVLERLGSTVAHRQGASRQQVLEMIADEAVRQGLDDTTGASVALAEAEGQGNGDMPRPDQGPGVAAGTATRGWFPSLDVYAGGRAVRALTANQQYYLEAIRTHDLVFGIGPAGTGKTYLAVAAAVHLMRAGQVKKLILVRPAVEAGEKLGFLPGDLQEKVNPYLRPLLDALHDMMDFATVQRFMETDVVEVAPLAFMRGRTLNNAVIILDEAQNTTTGQMKMFLTRMGRGSKTIVTGDTTQIDLPHPSESGLIDAARRLRRVSGVAFVALEKHDVVRHDLVQRVVEAYGGDDQHGPPATDFIGDVAGDKEGRDRRA